MLRKLFGTLIFAGLLAALVVGSAQSGGPSGQKKFYTPSGTPSTAPGGSSYTQYLTITNDMSSNQTLGSANITVPSGFTVPTSTTAYNFASGSGKSWGIRPGSTLSSTGPIPIGALTNLDVLNPGEAVTLSFTATAPCTVGTDGGAWKMQVKQANDFSGQGNDFQLASGASYPTTAVGAGGGSTVDHFNVALPSTPNPFKATAGSGFTVTVTAKDVCGNTASAYSGSPTLSGTLNDAPNGTHPSYGALSSFSSGQATGTVTAYKAETGGTITATAGTVTGTSSSFEVLPGAEDHMSFTQEPSDVQKATAMSPAVTVKIFDQWDNVKTNATGSMTLALNRNGSDPTSGSGTLTGGTATPSSGVATFSGLKINTSHTDYYLTASFGSATDEDSTTFKVLDSLINCSAVTGCHGHINNGKYSVDTTVPGGGDAGTLGLSLSGLGDSYGTCTRLDGSSTAGATPMGYQTVVPPSGYTLDHPITVVVVYPKSVAPGTGVANFILCKTYEETPPVVGAPVPGSYEMPDCPKSGAITAACISDRHRVGAGDLQVTMKIDSKDPVPSGLRGG